MPEFFSQTEFSMACEYGWRAAPPSHDGVATTNFSHKCYRAAGHAHSLHTCLDLCGPGASPVCCFLVEDQEKLLAVIESGFGSLAPFNSLIRGVFRDARATHLESLVVHLQREQTELKGMIESLLRHHGVPKVAPVEDELEA